MKLLVVEDESTMARFLKRGLTDEGYAVDVASTSDDADDAVTVHEYDLIVLDVMIPGRSGLELCARWRKKGLGAPILFLTARGEIQDRIAGLDAGGDDYLGKPFSFEELLARVRALLRRNLGPPHSPVIVCGDLELDTLAKVVRRAGQPVALTAREYQLLEYFARQAGKVVTRTELWEHVWESGSEPDSNVVDVYIGYLRGKLGRDPDLIETVRGTGYRLASNGGS